YGLQLGMAFAVTGALSGAVVGTAFPAWRLRWKTTPNRTLQGEFTRQAATGHAHEASDFPERWVDSQGGKQSGGIAALGLRAGRGRVGPEIMLANGFSTLLAAGGVVRVDVASGGGWAMPFALAGVGVYDWDHSKSTTLPLGVGLRFGEAKDWGAEVRWHQRI